MIPSLPTARTRFIAPRGWSEDWGVKRESQSVISEDPSSRITFYVSRYARQKPHQRVAMLQQFLFLPAGGQAQCVAFGVAEDEEAPRREQPRQVGVIEQALGEGGGTAAHVLLAVGRISQNEIEQ